MARRKFTVMAGSNNDDIKRAARAEAEWNARLSYKNIERIADDLDIHNHKYYLYVGPVDSKLDKGSQVTTSTQRFDVILSNITSASDVEYSYAVLQLGTA